MRTGFVVVGLCVIAVLAIGCRPSDDAIHDPDPVSAPSPRRETSSSEDPAAPTSDPEAPPLPEYSDEQIAAGKQLATDLGVVLEEDGAGNVILVDTAAGRSWVEDPRMEEILVFSRLTSLTVEGPSITDALAPRIAQHPLLATLALRNTLVGDDGISQFTALKFLKVIDLRVSPMVTDAALDTLAQTGIDGEGMARLRKALPECEIRSE